MKFVNTNIVENCDCVTRQGNYLDACNRCVVRKTERAKYKVKNDTRSNRLKEQKEELNQLRDRRQEKLQKFETLIVKHREQHEELCQLRKLR